jgi:DNA polymerase III sliding clamp (beta) subunit (PCNA family)
MTTLITIPTKYLKALKVFAGKKEEREYLNGIWLDISPKSVKAIATNGHILGVFNLAVPADITNSLHVIIPNDLLDRAKLGKSKQTYIVINEKAFKAEKDYSYHVTIRTDEGMHCDGISYNGGFPEYRSRIPSTTSGEAAHYNVTLLEKIAKAYRELHGSTKEYSYNAWIRQNGMQGGLFSLDEYDFIGVIMPVRPDVAKSTITRPEWLAA